MGQARLEQLLKKQDQLKARISSERAKLQKQQRKDDTRRKIIAGALALEHLNKHADTPFAREFARLLDAHVTRPGDRALLGLPDQPSQTSPVRGLIQSLQSAFTQ